MRDNKAEGVVGSLCGFVHPVAWKPTSDELSYCFGAHSIDDKSVPSHSMNGSWKFFKYQNF